MPKSTEFDNSGTSDDCIKIKQDANIPGNYLLDGPDIRDPSPDLNFRLYYCLQMFFANGGSDCFVVSAGTYTDYNITTAAQQITNALDAVEKEDDPTLIVFCDVAGLPAIDYYTLYQAALAQAAGLRDRFVIIDTLRNESISTLDSGFRFKIGINNLSFGAAYYPWLQTSLKYYYDEMELKIIDDNSQLWFLRNDDDNTYSVYHKCPLLYTEIINQMSKFRVELPPASAIAGVYAQVDAARGVWKAPANYSLNSVIKPIVSISSKEQNSMNYSQDGKSVNAIRSFPGKGVLVWGARTLAGNDNEWRYISVRRFFSIVEENLKKATEFCVFEPNNANTWVKAKAMIENYLNSKWRAGALSGSKPEDSYYVRVGLRQTMTPQDILDGKMIFEIGMAVVRPAEFIVLQFSKNMSSP